VDSLLGLLDFHRRNFRCPPVAKPSAWFETKVKADGRKPDRVGLLLDPRVSLNAKVAKKLGRLLAKTLRYIQIVRDEFNDLHTCASTIVLLAEWVGEKHSAAVLRDMGFSNADVATIRRVSHSPERWVRAIFSWEEERSSDSDVDTNMLSTNSRRKLSRGREPRTRRRAGQTPSSATPATRTSSRGPYRISTGTTGDSATPTAQTHATVRRCSTMHAAWTVTVSPSPHTLCSTPVPQ